MTYASVSTKFQIVIPKKVRERLEIHPGQKFIVWEKSGVIYLVPAIRFKAMRGRFKGMSIGNIRDESERM